MYSTSNTIHTSVKKAYMRAIPVRAAISMKIVAPNIAEGEMYTHSHPDK